MISAGFDAAKADPLGHLEFTRAGYEYMTEEYILDVATAIRKVARHYAA